MDARTTNELDELFDLDAEIDADDDDDGTITYDPSPTLDAFHASDAFIRGVKGPVGSGKSSGMVMEILRRATEQRPNTKGVRKFRALVVRNTYAELKSTTIKTFMEWLGHMGTLTMGSPIEFRATRSLPDKTVMQLEVYFLPLDREDDVKKLKSLEVTMAWINEASEVPEQALKVLRGRLRYPSKRDGGATWRGIILDTNPPSTRSWWYKLFETMRPKGHEVFHQPGGLVRDPDDPDEFLPNPLAENIANLPGGYDYYYDQVRGSTPDYITSMVLGEYAAVYNGKPVYHSYDDRVHCAKGSLHSIPNNILLVGMDWGLNPAAVFGQMSPTGTLNILDEIAPTDVTLDEFLDEYLIPRIAARYPRYAIQVIGDPSGENRSAMSQLNAFQTLRSRGIAAIPAPTNDFILRRDAVAYFLNKRTGFIMDSRCASLREALLGGYHYAVRGSGGEHKERPEKNYSSHVSDALQYLCLYYYRSAARPPRVRKASASTPFKYA